jgi:hypothetical protein
MKDGGANWHRDQHTAGLMIPFFENTWLLWWAIAFAAVIRFSHFFIEGVRSRSQPLRAKRDASNSKSRLFPRSEVAEH